MSRSVIFFVGNRLLDLDALTPFLLGLKHERPDFEIHIYLSSKEQKTNLIRNETLYQALREAGDVKLLAGNGTGLFGRLSAAFRRHIQVSSDLLRHSRPILIRSRAFDEGIYRRAWLISRLRRGRAILMIGVRFIEEAMPGGQVEEIVRSQPRPNSGWFQRLLGGSADALVWYHDQQPVIPSVIAPDLHCRPERTFRFGLTNLIPAWQAHIEKRAAEFRRSISGAAPTDLLTIFAGKSIQARWVRGGDAIGASYRATLAAIARHAPDSLVLVRAHPAGIDEKFLSEGLADNPDLRIEFTFEHPDVLARVSNAVFFTAPTNIMSTLNEGHLIDCLDYSDQQLAAQKGRSTYADYGIHYACPRDDDFDARIAALIDQARTGRRGREKSAFCSRSQPRLQEYIAFVDAL